MFDIVCLYYVALYILLRNRDFPLEFGVNALFEVFRHSAPRQTILFLLLLETDFSSLFRVPLQANTSHSSVPF